MRTATVDGGRSKEDAKRICRETRGWTPAEVRKVDSGGKGNAWMCFESAEDARIWDNQK